MERNSFNGPLIWSTICLAAVALLVILAIPPLVEAAFGPDVDMKSTESRFAALLETHDATRDMYTQRFDGRSIFYKPKPPRVELPPRPPRDTSVKRDPEPVREVRRTRPPYSGPSVKGFVGSLVFFDDALTVMVGEEANGIEVLSVEDAPRTIKVKYSGWEYDLDFAAGVPSDFFGRPAPSRSRMPGLTTVESAAKAGSDKTETPDDPASRQAAAPGGTRSARSSGRNVAVPVNPKEAEDIERPATVDDSPPPR